MCAICVQFVCPEILKNYPDLFQEPSSGGINLQSGQQIFNVMNESKGIFNNIFKKPYAFNILKVLLETSIKGGCVFIQENL